MRLNAGHVGHIIRGSVRSRAKQSKAKQSVKLQPFTHHHTTTNIQPQIHFNLIPKGTFSVRTASISTELKPTQLNSTKHNSTRLNSTPSSQATLQTSSNRSLGVWPPFEGTKPQSANRKLFHSDLSHDGRIPRYLDAHYHTIPYLTSRHEPPILSLAASSSLATYSQSTVAPRKTSTPPHLESLLKGHIPRHSSLKPALPLLLTTATKATYYQSQLRRSITGIPSAPEPFPSTEAHKLQQPQSSWRPRNHPPPSSRTRMPSTS